MTEAVFGLLGVLVGAGLTWPKDGLSESLSRKRHTRYLAIRVVCIKKKIKQVRVARDNTPPIFTAVAATSGEGKAEA